MTSGDQFQTRLALSTALVEAGLTAQLDALAGRGADRLLAAMRHAVLGGGKRFRPFLVMETASMFGVDPEVSVTAAAAVEYIHCYSLVHDDLPAMDDDDVRRGQPTVHVAFDEATAILAGDALQTLAFETLTSDAAHGDPGVRSALVQELARASGLCGMAGGQMFDLEAETASPASVDIERIQAMKTGALIAAAVAMGAVLGGASTEERALLADYATHLGLAFQISDDFLDVTGDAATVGKAVGKDAGANKATFVSRLGPAGARSKLAETEQQALQALSSFGNRADALRGAVAFMSARQS